MSQRVGWAILLALFFGALGAKAGDKSGPAIGAVALDFKSRDVVTHAPIHLSAQTGKVVVLTFWATWCAPCRQELPILEGLQSQVSKDELVICAVPFQAPDKAYGELERIFRPLKVTLVDDRNGHIAERYGIRSLPHLFLIGRDGKIAAEHTGYGARSQDELVADINAALAATPPAAAPAEDRSPH